MTKDDILRMAREAGGSFEELPLCDAWLFYEEEYLERFAALVAAAERERVMNEPINKEHWQRFEDEIRAAEREACAKVCDATAKKMDEEGEGPTGYIAWVTDCADAIRARGQA
jgi:hypothetical protein